jgi:formate hydrogenlyase subunit 3/multisubunit Na+/H+ antiporter MnhD subunit
VVMIITILLLCFVIYAMSTRFMHIIFSDPRNIPEPVPDKVNPVETISQFILMGIVIIMCVYQPPFMVDLINQSLALLPK